jgi:hypothetical protein
MDKEPWSSMEGGDNTPEVAQAFPGGMKPLKALGGFPKPTPLTVMRPWEESLVAVYKKLWSAAGSAEVKASYRLLNANKEPIGEPVAYTGVLGTVTRPGYKAGTSEEAKLSITVDLDGEIS